MPDNLPVWTREDIARRIHDGEHILIRHGNVLKIPEKWLTSHPGGSLAILHFIGRDASQEMDAYHSEDTFKRMNAYVVARVQLPWDPLLPPVMSGWVRTKTGWQRDASPGQVLLLKNSDFDLQPPPTTLSLKIQEQHVQAYRELHQRVKEAGLYQTRYVAGYGPEIIRYMLLLVCSLYTYRHSWFITSAIFLGGLWHQLAFFAHDLGHNGVSHNRTIDRLLGIFVTDFLGGVSIGWWVDNHNIHHLVTNHPAHDPDIQHIPFFAISPAFFTGLWSTYYKRVMSFDSVAAALVPLQHKLFYVVLSLARFNLYANSYSFLALRARRRWDWAVELLALVGFWIWYGWVLFGTGNWKIALGYLLVSNMVASPVHVQIVLSHFSRSTDDLGPVESFPARQLRTTTDVICPPYLAFFHGGLHLQVTHHLFPRLPRHNLRAASKLVKEYAREQGLEYAEFGFIEGNKEIRGVLQQVAQQVHIIKQVADSNIKERMGLTDN